MIPNKQNCKPEGPVPIHPAHTLRNLFVNFIKIFLVKAARKAIFAPKDSSHDCDGYPHFPASSRRTSALDDSGAGGWLLRRISLFSPCTASSPPSGLAPDSFNSPHPESKFWKQDS